MEALASGYHQLLEWYSAQPDCVTEMDPGLKLAGADQPGVPLPTMSHEVSPSGNYAGALVTVVKFEQQYQRASGLSQPMILTVHCSDGRKRKQVLKGRDDMRQDAVIEQAFRLVNAQLRRATAASRDLLRGCRMATYNAVPLGPNSGVIEFCDGTISLGNYLIQDPAYGKGAHQRYYPKGPNPHDCMSEMKKAKDSNSLANQEKALRSIFARFRPVMRHFFYEHYHHPRDWFDRQRAYTRSVATGSMVGFVLGLGDRHVQNILIKVDTAEIIHIDLGVAFEQGRLLPTPEIVPFRLTRDVVDGMGLTGVEGLFRRCCEWNLRVLRESKRNLLPIFNVLLHDPFTTWTLDPAKMSRLQPAAKGKDKIDSSGNLSAQRVIFRLTDKLDGKDQATWYSVEGHVNYLMREAMSINNLSRMYFGWQPYL